MLNNNAINKEVIKTLFKYFLSCVLQFSSLLPVINLGGSSQMRKDLKMNSFQNKNKSEAQPSL